MKKISVNELKRMWVNFFVEKGHVQIPSSSLVPENDNSVLFTTAGMHPLVPYILGKEHPAGKRLVDFQKCLRTNDIDSVGDDSHCTFFEMLGNWSLGDYFKKEMIPFSFEFLTSEKYLNIPLERLAVTVFAGDENAPRDEESARIWKSLGLKDEQIFFLGKEHNWWSAGETGPCGPDTEMFFVNLDKPKCSEHCGPDCDCGRYMEIWNDVFMEYIVEKPNGKPRLNPQKTVDTGMGLERALAKINGYESVYDTDIFKGIIDFIVEKSGKEYNNQKYKKHMRIIADHMRASTFILGDETTTLPSNTGAGYILRRLIRRSVNSARVLEIESSMLIEIAKKYVEIYEEFYPSLKKNEELIISELEREINKFNHTILSGIREFNKVLRKGEKVICGDDAFKLYDTYGFPVELTEEMANENGVSVDMEGFEEAFKRHQEKSKASCTKIFKGGLSGHTEMDIKYHTTQHILLAALREKFGNDIFQKGSNITPERLRLDFNFPRKLTKEELQEIEDRVNEVIRQNLVVKKEIMSLEDAKKSGALGSFEDRYMDTVSVYSIGDYSKEICGGPHVENTSVLGTFKIKKEESSSSGVRRIKAILE